MIGDIYEGDSLFSVGPDQEENKGGLSAGVRRRTKGHGKTVTEMRIGNTFGGGRNGLGNG